MWTHGDQSCESGSYKVSPLTELYISGSRDRRQYYAVHGNAKGHVFIRPPCSSALIFVLIGTW